MVRDWVRRLPPAAVLIAMCAVFGCHGAPSGYTVARFGEAEAVRLEAPEFWEAERVPQVTAEYSGALAAARPDAPRASDLAGGLRTRPRVVVAEFSVEYVTDKLEGMFQRQPVAGATEFGTIGLPATLAGFGRTTVRFDQALMSNLPYDLYLRFAALLEGEGYDVVPLAEVAQSEAYRNFQTASPGTTSVAQLFNITGTDTGRAKRVVYWPAEGLEVIVGTGDTGDQTARALLDELGADAALFARFRVGIWRGRASVEMGSRMRVVTREGAGRIVAQRSLISEAMAVESAPWRLFRGRTYPVNTDAYIEAMETLFGPFAQMAVARLKEQTTTHLGRSDAIVPSTPLQMAQASMNRR